MSEEILNKKLDRHSAQKPQGLELLAPAQNKECAKLAIDCGADSVYIGANLFGARKNACNTLEDIEEIINYAHKFNVKVYVTINTILDDNELPEAISLIHKLHKIKTDGIIFQDFGILKAANDGKLPDIKLIASTQCDNRTKEKVKFFESLGVGRVILARELSIDKIGEICDSTDVEIETFIHGALCVSYSGQCYLSCKIGGRSANKGECAQACRKKYSLIDENGKIIAKNKYLLSLKDFMAKDELEALIEAGVTSFKIEGRLKDTNYIKNTVLFYRHAIDEILKKKNLKRSSSGRTFLPVENAGTEEFQPNPKKSFNRDFCKYFLSGKRGNIWNFNTPNSVGEFLGRVKTVHKDSFTLNLIDKNVKIHPQDGLCFFTNAKRAKNGAQGSLGNILKGMLVNSVKNGKIYPNLMPEIQEGVEIYRNKDAHFENTLKNLSPKRQIGVNFRVYDGFIEAEDEDKNKAALEFCTNEPAKNAEAQKTAWLCALQKTGNSDFYIENIEFLSKEVYFLRKSELNEIRRNVLEKLMAQRLQAYKPQVQPKIAPANFPTSSGDYRLNVHNREAKEFYEKCGCKVLETSFESGKKPLNNVENGKEKPNTQNQNSTPKKAELMRTKHCIRFALNMCLKNPNSGLKNKPQENVTKTLKDRKNNTKEPELFLIDEKGAKYSLHFDCANCEMIIEE